MIDEKKLIEDFKNTFSDSVLNQTFGLGEYTFLEVVEEMINRQPKVGEWIPCSERLPKRQDSRNTILKMYLVQGRFDRIYKGFRDENGVWKNEHGNIIKPVIAWMPLPEPYQKE